MRHHLVRLALGALALSAPLGLIQWTARPEAERRAALASGAMPPARVPAPDGRVIDSLLDAAIARAPFRLARRPAARAYDPEARGAAAATPAAVQPKPALVLTGVVLGPEPAAIIEGIPGHEGSAVLRMGAAEGGIRVRRISANAVVLVGMDTAWTLTVRNPWH